VHYNAFGPGFLWHLDTWHKLGNVCGIVVVAIIDGYTRQCVSLAANKDNFAASVFESVLPALIEKGCPRFLRIDAGMENIAVARLMHSVRGEDSVLVGKSVHNQRIERFWRDVRTQVLHSFVDFCKNLTRENPAMAFPNGIWLLQYLFLPRINIELHNFQIAWNNHTLTSVVGNLSPNALTMTGRRLYYRPIDHRVHNVQEIIQEINHEYVEGRPSSRGESPFTTEAGEAFFKSRISPIELTTPSTEWFHILQTAIDQVHETVLLEANDAIVL
jgi:hypothetical protein